MTEAALIRASGYPGPNLWYLLPTQDTFARQALFLQSHAQLVPTMPWLLRATVNPAPRGEF